MRPPRPIRALQPLFVCLVVVAAAQLACRDEQAGPKGALSASNSTRPHAQESIRQPSPGTVLDAAPEDLTYRSGATFADGAIEYLGSKLDPPTPQPGARVQLSHYFRAVKQPPQGWMYFMHIVDPESGQMLGNADHEFAGGGLPLEKWPVGKVVVDSHGLQAPGSPARLVLGFWQGDARLPIDQPDRRDGQMRALGPNLGPAPPPLPEYRAHRAKAALAIDGDLGDKAWKDATPVVLTQSFNGGRAERVTTARILYDDAFLYVAFDVEDPDVWGTLMNRDDAIYTQEVVEVFLDADANLRTYNELQVSPNNVIFDAYFPARRQGMDLGWDSKMQTGVKVRGTVNDDSDRDEGWSAELKIPFATLADVPRTPPQKGDVWRFNLYRLELPDRRSQQGQSFSPLFVGDFHALPRFGRLVFD